MILLSRADRGAYNTLQTSNLAEEGKSYPHQPSDAFGTSTTVSSFYSCPTFTKYGTHNIREQFTVSSLPFSTDHCGLTVNLCAYVSSIFHKQSTGAFFCHQSLQHQTIKNYPVVNKT